MTCLALTSGRILTWRRRAPQLTSGRSAQARPGALKLKSFAPIFGAPAREVKDHFSCRATSVESFLEALQPVYVKAMAALTGPDLDLGSLDVRGNASILGVLAACILALVSFVISSKLGRKKKNRPPTIPGGVPILGNMLQLTERKPHKTFTKWAQQYGPIFHVKMGSINNLVVSSADLAKEIMVTNFDSISTRRMTTPLKVLTGNKTMVAMSDYGDEHRMLKKMVVGNLLGVTAQRANRIIRVEALNTMIDEMFRDLHGENATLDIRQCIQYALFPFAMRQVFGYVPETLSVEGLGELTKWDIFNILVTLPLKHVIDVDWRDYFPAFRWVPNRELENNLMSTHENKLRVVDALILEQRKQLVTREPSGCYADILLTQYPHLSELQLQHSVWEPIIESADTTLVTSEWALFEIAKDSKIQQRLYDEIISVVGTDRMVTEDDYPNLPLLEAVVKETLRFYSPVTILPPRYIHENIKVGGYDIPKDWDVLINIYGINMDPKVWSNPEVWDPYRCYGDKTLDLGVKDFRVLPFGGGKRMCAGITQAFNIIPMNIAAIVQHFELSLPLEENQNAEDTVYLTSHKLHPLRAHLKPRVKGRLPSQGLSASKVPAECPAHRAVVASDTGLA